MPRRKMRPVSPLLPAPFSSAVSTCTPIIRPMPKPNSTPIGSQPFSTNGNSPGAYRPSSTASVSDISMKDAREIATGTASRVRSSMSLGRAQAGKRDFGEAVMG